MSLRNCPVCGKTLTVFNRKPVKLFSVVQCCSKECVRQYNERKQQVKQLEKEGMAVEMKCTCRKCGHVWYYDPNEKERQDRQELGKDFIQASMSIPGIMVGSLRQNQRQLDTCPSCNSRDVKEEVTQFRRR